jgi:DNA-binding beta-propeller fold protein YncE
MATLIAGTLEKSFDITSSSLTSAVANAAESILYLTDAGTSGAVIRSVPLPAFNSSAVIAATGITSPQGLALSTDETKLYVLSAAGVIFECVIATGLITQLVDFGTPLNITSGWRRLISDPMSSNHLLATNSGRKMVIRINISTNTFVRFFDFTFFVTGIGRDRSNSRVLYVGGYRQSASTGRLIRAFRDANGFIERWELFAGSGIGTTAVDGELLKVCNVLAPSAIVTPPDGTIQYFNNGTQYINNNNSLARFTAGVSPTSLLFTLLPISNKIITANAAFRLVMLQ